MAEHDDRSLFDRAKDALGFGGDDHDTENRRHREDRQIDTEGPAADANRPGDEGWGDVSGATEASGWTGASAGTGATGAMGGAGAAGPTGIDGPTEDNDAAVGPSADPGAVRTEYEMGHELDPDHETRAESGVLSGTVGSTHGGERPPAADEGSSGAGQYGAEPVGGAETHGGTSAGTRGEAASGQSPFDEERERDEPR